MIAEEAYVLSKSFTNNSIKGITGALAGKNCTIKSATKADGVTTVVFAWTADDGTEKTTTIQVNDGAKGDIGIGIDNVTINANSHLIVTLSDGSTIDAGLIQGGSGTDDYEDLINRPKIEGVDLIGNKTFEDLGVASATDLAQTNGHLQDKVDKTSIATELSDVSTNDEVVGAKLAYDELKKAELANKEQFATARGEAISVNDSVDGKIRDLKLYGKSEQKQYSGKNLLNATMETFTIDGVTFKSNSDGTYTVTGTSTRKGEYEIGRIELSAGNYKLLGFQGTGIMNEFCLYTYTGTRYPNDIGEGVNFTLSDTRTIYVRLAIPNGTTINMLLKPMIVDTSLYPDATYDDFEPYVGGTPSPNPNYPQEIKSVVNPVVKVCGKNLLNPTLKTTTKNGVTCTANGDGTYTLNGTVTCDDGKAYAEIILGEAYTKGNVCKIVCSKNVPKSCYAQVYNRNWSIDVTENSGLTIPSTTDKLFLRYVIANRVILNNVLIKPMITTDLDATYDDYVPYQGEQTATLPYTLNAIPVESGGNVTINGQEYIADYVDFEKKKLVKNVGIADLGTITPELVTASGSKIFRYSSLAKKLPPNFSAKSNVIAESCKSVGNVGTWLSIIEKGDNVIGTVSAGNEYGFIIRDSSFTDVNSFKQAMTGSMICYELATPTITYLTDEEVQAFKELATYYPTTNVFVTSEQLNGYAEFKYPTTDVSGLVSRNESRIVDIEGTVGSTDISDIGDGTITNAISMMSSKLGGLTFSASGTTLTITNGTNTWTLEANS